jgi:hypothetical protein
MNLFDNKIWIPEKISGLVINKDKILLVIEKFKSHFFAGK